MEKKEKLIGSIVMIVMCLIFLTVGYFGTKPKANNAEVTVQNDQVKNKEEVIIDKSNSSQEKEHNNEYKKIVVEIKGEVKKPKVYDMKYGTRVYELIEKAGGYTENADTTCVNGSMKLKDEDCIIICKKGESNKTNNNTINRSNSIKESSSESDKIDINAATKEDLKTLPGVGEVTAEKIIEYRDKNGGFTSVDELTKVDRIGEKTLAKFKDKIQVR
ncbi:ComEA family DNA-binding protein [Clostridium sp. MB40-C1]|uniref:ComEA family DNA-binding protein n=1 Tax=Clostridium sp. MB40-C1 TaxID=3070996 RepID=UPI0027DF83E5|nr:ComEA family DNA-binding protein [Clostridium sp. MB40-C1]WMJ82329.1 ComEA family DNA-binding protein [Clostridium sp. MB40-C1]